MKQRNSIQNIMRLRKHLVQVLKKFESKTTQRSFIQNFLKPKMFGLRVQEKNLFKKQNEIVFDQNLLGKH
jgi:hypothetical protein